MAVNIDKDTCTGCGVCIDTCPVNALTLNDIAVCDADTCTDCAACVDECPVSAMSM